MPFTLHTVLTHLLGVVIRVAVVVGVDQCYRLLIERQADSSDANIGLGLLGFVVLIVVAVIGGTWDGWRRGAVSASVLWIATGLVAGVAMVVLMNLAEAPLDTDVLRSDLVTLAPFLAQLMIVPAVVSALIAWRCREARRPRP